MPGTPYPPEQQAAVFKAIEEHIAEFGPRTYGKIFEQFPDVNRSTIWNWIKRVRENPPSQDRIRALHHQLQERIKNGADRTLPAPPPAGLYTDDPATAMARLDFAAEIPRLYRDAEMLRSFSILERTDEATGLKYEKIRNPVAFEKSIRARAAIIESGLSVMKELWNIATIQRFYEMMIEEIGKADIDTQKRILVRMRSLSERYGMTMSMGA